MSKFATLWRRVAAAVFALSLSMCLLLQTNVAFAQPIDDNIRAKTNVPSSAEVEPIIKYSRTLQTYGVAAGAFSPSNNPVAARITVLVKDATGRPVSNLIDDKESEPANTSEQGQAVDIGPFRITARLPVSNNEIFPVSCDFVAYRARNLSDEGIYGGYEFLGDFKRGSTACVYKIYKVLATGESGQDYQATVPEPVIYSVILEGGAGKNKNQYGITLGEIHPPVSPKPNATP